jgi:hypothetical protein
MPKVNINKYGAIVTGDVAAFLGVKPGTKLKWSEITQKTYAVLRPRYDETTKMYNMTGHPKAALVKKIWGKLKLEFTDPAKLKSCKRCLKSIVVGR